MSIKATSGSSRVFSKNKVKSQEKNKGKTKEKLNKYNSNKNKEFAKAQLRENFQAMGDILFKTPWSALSTPTTTKKKLINKELDKFRRERIHMNNRIASASIERNWRKVKKTIKKQIDKLYPEGTKGRKKVLRETQQMLSSFLQTCREQKTPEKIMSLQFNIPGNKKIATVLTNNLEGIKEVEAKRKMVINTLKSQVPPKGLKEISEKKMKRIDKKIMLARVGRTAYATGMMPLYLTLMAPSAVIWTGVATVDALKVRATGKGFTGETNAEFEKKISDVTLSENSTTDQSRN